MSPICHPYLENRNKQGLQGGWETLRHKRYSWGEIDLGTVPRLQAPRVQRQSQTDTFPNAPQAQPFSQPAASRDSPSLLVELKSEMVSRTHESNLPPPIPNLACIVYF